MKRPKPVEERMSIALAKQTTRLVNYYGGKVISIEGMLLSPDGVELAMEFGWLEPWANEGCQITDLGKKEARILRPRKNKKSVAISEDE